MIGFVAAGVLIVAALKSPAVKTTIKGGRADFARQVLDAAARVDMKGIPPKFALSMAALETGWGTGNVFKSTNNLFSITAGTKWRGPTFKASTGFVFRVYASLEESLVDYVRLISTVKLYSVAYQAAIRQDAFGFFGAVQKAGYAGDDVHYASKLSKTLEVV